jgi:RinA family phage transcriptional activator
MNVQKANIKLIEAELRNYKETLKDIENMREEIIEGSTYQEVSVQTGTTGNSTYNKASRLLSSRGLIEAEKRVEAIEYTIGVLKSCPEPKKLQLLKLKYFAREFTDYGIQIHLNIEKTTFYRWRKEILSIVADRLGWQI